MLKKYRKMLETETSNDSEIENGNENRELPKERKSFFSVLKSFFANILTFGLYGRIKKRQKIKLLKQMEEETFESSKVSKVGKVSVDELEKEMDEVAKDSKTAESENQRDKGSNTKESENESEVEAQRGE